MNPTTSFRELKEQGACQPRYRHLARALGRIKEYGADTPITSRQILDANGEDDVLWAWENCPSLKPLGDDYRAKLKPLGDDYRAKLKPIDDDYRAKLKPIDDDYWAKLKPIDDDYWAKRNALIRQVIEEWEVSK